MRKRSLPQPEERTERRIYAATSLSICALTVIAQIVLTLALTQLLAEKISYVYFILELAGAVVAIWVYLRPGSPSYKLVWMCLLLALPVAGMILFLLWGGSHQAKSLSLRKVAPPVEREGPSGQRRQCGPPEPPLPGLGTAGLLFAVAGLPAVRRLTGPVFRGGSRFLR